jgi:hypothetical protein
LSKYRQLLLTKLGNEVSIYQFLMGTDDPAVYRECMGTNCANNKTVDATIPWAIKANIQLWKKVVELHLCNMDDIDHHVSSVRNALPRMPSSNEDQIHVKPPYTNPLMSHQEHHLIIPFLTLLIISCHTGMVIRADPGDQTPEV